MHTKQNLNIFFGSYKKANLNRRSTALEKNILLSREICYFLILQDVYS